MVRRRTWLMVILFVALTGRLLAAWMVQQRVGDQLCLIAGDAEGYWELARRIAAGDEYSLYDPPRRVHRMPGFPALLALSMKLFGKSPIAARCVLALIGTAACAAVFWLGRGLFDERVGLIACGLTAISPVMTGFSVLLLSETLFALLLTISVCCAAKWLGGSEGGRWKAEGGKQKAEGSEKSAVQWALATGITIALATLVRPSWLLSGPILATAVIALSFSKNPCGLRTSDFGLRREALLMLATLFLTLLPWAWRNHDVCGHWVFTTLWSGPSLYDGLNPEANGDSNMTFFDRDDLMRSRGMTEWEVDQHYRQAAWRYAREHPARTIELTFLKAWRYWKPWPSAAQFGGIGPALLVAGFFVPLVIFAARGVWSTRGQTLCWMLTLGPILYFGAVHSVFVGSLRYRLPAEYPMCVLAAIGLNDWYQRFQRRKSDE